jgi:phage FluMu gp28-like protein
MLKGEAVAYVTPEFGLGKDFFREILKYIPSEIIKTDNKSELYIELITGGSLKFFSGEALSSFRGRKFHYVIVDEAAFISDLKEAWDTAIRPTLSDYRGGALFISTPNGKEYFNSLYMKGKDELQSEYQSFHFGSNMNPYFSPEEFESARKSIPAFRFNQEYLALPGENQNNPFGTDNINLNILQELSNEETVVYGIDVAKYSDYTVIIGLDSKGNMTYFDRFQTPWTITAQKIKALPDGILKVMDSTGVGDVLLEQIIDTTPNLIGFKFTTESKPKIVYELINAVEKGDVKYNQQTADEMFVYTYKYSSTGHIKFEAQSGYNDDIVTALAIAYYHMSQAEANKDWKLFFV